MSATLISIVTLIYVGVSVSEWLNDNLPMSITFGGYALANVGLIIQTWR